MGIGKPLGVMSVKRISILGCAAQGCAWCGAAAHVKPRENVATVGGGGAVNQMSADRKRVTGTRSGWTTWA